MDNWLEPHGKVCVLLADDRVVTRNLIRRALTQEGYWVAAAAGVEEALELSAVFKGEFAVLLVNLASSDAAMELTRRIQTERPRTRVLVLRVRRPPLPDDLLRKIRDAAAGPSFPREPEFL